MTKKEVERGFQMGATLELVVIAYAVIMGREWLLWFALACLAIICATAAYRYNKATPDSEPKPEGK